MRFGIDLRSDLAKLSDTEIAAEMDRLLNERQALYDSIPAIAVDQKWLYRSGLMFLFGRGLVHSRSIYQLVSGYFGPFKHSPFGALYRYDCEIKDLHDEIEHRVKQQKAGAGIGR